MIVRICGSIVAGSSTLSDPTTLHDITKAVHEVTTKSLEGTLLPFAYLADFLCDHVTIIENAGGYLTGIGWH